MNEKILRIAENKFNQLVKKYQSFVNVIVDDWRGYRFVFDTEDVRKCNNRCQKCPLFLLLKEEKESVFSAGLYKATEKDKLFFGFQNYLNCKSLEEYKDCYVNFLLRKCRTKEEMKEELELMDNCRVIFSKNQDCSKIEDNFKNSILQKVLLLSDQNQRRIIEEVIDCKYN